VVLLMERREFRSGKERKMRSVGHPPGWNDFDSVERELCEVGEDKVALDLRQVKF